MATLHLHLPEEREPCGYLSDRQATMEYRVMTEVSPGELEWMLIRGWRRFGHLYFRPACPNCAECVSLRIPVINFTPTKSQRRARRKCDHLRIITRPPIVDDERLELYHAWHEMRENTRGWRVSRIGAEEYTRTFAEPHPCAREMDYYDGDRLVGVEYAQQRGLSHLYLGYRVQECPSTAYKSQFKPHDLLAARPAFNEAPSWKPVTE
jgi:arginyl-tRNA--protein-N-Asp/Glu arginylyltransferase